MIFDKANNSFTFRFENTKGICYKKFISIDDGLTDSCRAENFDVKFRWSKNGKEFSEIMNYDIEIINILNFVANKYFVVEFFYTYKKTDDFCIDKFSLILEESKSKTSSVPLEIFKEKTESNYVPCGAYQNCGFNIYDSIKNCAITNAQLKTNMTVNAFGFEIDYIRLNPIIESGDPFLMEWGLFHYDTPRKMKILIPDNEIPSDWNLQKFGLTYDNFEIEIDKYTFECLFGIGSAPQKDDYIYFKNPLNRMYQINSIDVVRSAFFVITGFKCSLSQAYQKQNVTLPEEELNIKSNISENPNISDLQSNIDTFLKLNEDSIRTVFGDELNSEYDDVTNEKELLPNISSVKKYNTKHLHFNDKLCIRYEDLYMGDVLFSKAHYYQTNLFKHKGENLITYNIRDRFCNTDNFVFSSWINIPNAKQKNYNIKAMTKHVDNIIELKMETFPLANEAKTGDRYLLSDDVIFFDCEFISYSRANKLLKLKVISDMFDTNIISGQTHITKYEKLNLIYSNEIEINYLINGIFEIRIGKTVNYFKREIENNTWYGVMFKYLANLGNTISMNIFSPYLKHKDISFFENIIDCGERVNLESINQFNIKISNIKLTQIRIAKENINNENMEKYFKSYLLEDTSKLLISDVCSPQFNNEYIGSVD